MTDTSNEDDFRERFADLRREESRAAPAFARSLATARQRRARPAIRPWTYAAVAVPLATLVALAFWVFRSPESSGQRPQIASLTETETGSVGRWESPTDELLAVPAFDLLRTLPALGVSDYDDLQLPEESPPAADSSASTSTRRYA